MRWLLGLIIDYLRPFVDPQGMRGPVRLRDALRSTPPNIRALVDILAGFSLVVSAFLALGPLALRRIVRLLINGMFSQQQLRRAIDRALATRLLEKLSDKSPQPGMLSPKARFQADMEEARRNNDLVVRFEHLRLDQGKGIRPLAVVATDIESQHLQLFSTTETPQVFVAEAVAASMALPVLFEPALVRDAVRFYDGAFLSNYPLWPFDAERTVDADLHSMGIEIIDRNVLTPRNALQRIEALVKTTMVWHAAS